MAINRNIDIHFEKAKTVINQTATTLTAASHLMYGLRDNEVLLPTGYEVIVTPPPGGAAQIFHEGF